MNSEPPQAAESGSGACNPVDRMTSVNTATMSPVFLITVVTIFRILTRSWNTGIMDVPELLLHFLPISYTTNILTYHVVDTDNNRIEMSDFYYSV